jgi:cyanophycin synthetase
MATHRAQGQRVVFVDGDAIVAAEGSFEKRLPLAGIPTRNGTIGFQVENAMASVGAAWAWAWTGQITGGLASFVNDAAPRRAASTCSTTRAPP